MKKKVYYFKDWPAGGNDYQRSQRAATLDALKHIPSAVPLMDTEFEVDESELDGDGFVKKDTGPKSN